jgi:hypothetical protein
MPLPRFEPVYGERYILIGGINHGVGAGTHWAKFDGTNMDGTLRWIECIRLDFDCPDFSIEAAGIIDIQHCPADIVLEPEWTPEFEQLERAKDVRVAGEI